MMDFIAHHAGLIGLLFFFTFFIVLLGWLFRPGSSRDYILKANIPLNEDGNHE